MTKPAPEETDAQTHERWMRDYFRTARPDPERVIRWQPVEPETDDLADLLCTPK